MPFYQYRARNNRGALVTGTIEADDDSTCEQALESKGLIPIRVSRAGKRAGTSAFRNLFNRVTPRDIIVFSRQLATLFAAGVPLTRSLGALERQAVNPVFREVVKKVREDVEGGASFHEALARHPKVFGELYSNMVEAGETGGILDGVLARLALMLEKDAENRAKIKSATLYPKIVLGAIATALLVIMNFVIPRFAELYASFRVELPLPTRMLIAASDVFTSYWYLALAAAAAAYVLLRMYFKTEKGRLNRDRLVLRLPVFGPIILKSVIARYSRVLGSLYRSGIPMLQSLDIVSRATENKAVEADILVIGEEVKKGRPLSEQMEKSRRFPPMVVQMVSVGEETGGLDDMLDKAAEYYEQEVDASIRNLTTTLEPLLLGFIFAMVLFLALAIFLPMWDIVKFVRR